MGTCYPAHMRADPVERRLALLTPENPDELRAALASRIGVLAAKAAHIVGKHGMAELEADVAAAFGRFFTAPDKGCAARLALAKALAALDHSSPEPFLRGARHVQMEGSFGPPVDTAGELRGVSVVGLEQTRHPKAFLEITRLLADPEPAARAGAVRAIHNSGREEGTWLICLRVLTGEQDADVLAGCFAALLDLAPEDSLPFVAGYLDASAPGIAETAALALGESHRKPAFAILKNAAEEKLALRRTLLIAIGLLRRDEAFEYLTVLARGGDAQARAALKLIGRDPAS